VAELEQALQFERAKASEDGMSYALAVQRLEQGQQRFEAEQQATAQQLQSLQSDLQKLRQVMLVPACSARSACTFPCTRAIAGCRSVRAC
jgi:hypothetical protein